MPLDDLIFARIRRCRLCNSDQLFPIWDLGQLYLSDFLPKVSPLAPKAGLKLLLCERCSLVQLAETIDPEYLYRGYWYESGLNERMRQVLQETAVAATKRLQVRSGDVAIDIGCNDGTMLSYFPDKMTKIGVDPSGIPSVSDKVQIIKQFWPTSALAGVRARVITTVACFYDQHDIHGFMQAVVDHLTDDGYWIVQQTMAEDMYQEHAWDNICHEHVTYWTERALTRLANQYGMRLIDKEAVDVNGASMRYTYRRGLVHERPADGPLALNAHSWSRWTQECQDGIRRMRKLLVRMRREGRAVAGYGASTKGNTMLQMWGADTSLIPYIADRNPRKRGLLTAGSWIPIVSEELMRYLRPETLVVLPWGFASAFRERERDYLDGGGKMVIPSPFPEVLDASGSAQAVTTGAR